MYAVIVRSAGTARDVNSIREYQVLASIYDEPTLIQVEIDSIIAVYKAKIKVFIYLSIICLSFYLYLSFISRYLFIFE